MSRVDGRLYVGNPNGPTAWLANLSAADAATLQIKGQPAVLVRAVPLGLGPEREAAIRATARQEWFFIRPVYWASTRPHRCGPACTTAWTSSPERQTAFDRSLSGRRGATRCDALLGIDGGVDGHRFTFESRRPAGDAPTGIDAIPPRPGG